MPAVQALLLERGAGQLSDLPMRVAVVHYNDAQAVERLLSGGARHSPAANQQPILPAAGGHVQAQMLGAACQHSALGHAMRGKRKVAAVAALRRSGATLHDVDFFGAMVARNFQGELGAQSFTVPAHSTATK